jgi:hypothetical protein
MKWKRLAKNRKPFHLEAPGIEPGTPPTQVKVGKELMSTPAETLPFFLPHESQNDPDLLRVLAAWSRLSAPIRAGILAMVEASGRQE